MLRRWCISGLYIVGVFCVIGRANPAPTWLLNWESVFRFPFSVLTTLRVLETWLYSLSA